MHEIFSRQPSACLKAWFHGRFFSAECEIFRMFLLNCEQSSRNNLFEWSQFKRNRRNNSPFADKKRPWNQAFRGRAVFQFYFRTILKNTKNQFHIIKTLQSTNKKFVGSSGISTRIFDCSVRLIWNSFFVSQRTVLKYNWNTARHDAIPEIQDVLYGKLFQLL